MSFADDICLVAWHHVEGHAWATDGEHLLLTCGRLSDICSPDMPEIACLVSVQQALVLIAQRGRVAIACEHAQLLSGAPCPGEELSRLLLAQNAEEGATP